MKHEIISTENYLLVVSDEKPTTEREWVYDTVYNTEFKDVRKATTLDTTKIIAHLPLNGAPYLDGVDVLPEIKDEVVNLGTEHFWTSQQPNISAYSFIEGYNKAKETYKYTEEDMIEFAIWRSITKFDSPYTPFGEFKIWESLQQPKLPIAFECETVPYHGGEFIDDGKTHVVDVKFKRETITDSAGRTQWVGTYEF